jgi:coenzyme F420-reducing hydrogenase delta subunit/Pyruvate/2-oxoacid:ferredoxin oxidoreductase delta subunit
MIENKALLILEDKCSDLAAKLDMDNLVQKLKSRDDLTVMTFAVEKDSDPYSEINAQCAGKGYAGIVLAGSAKFLRAMPELVVVDKDGPSLRVQKVNILEWCAGLHSKSDSTNELALRQIQMGLAKAVVSLPIVFKERKTKKQVAIFGCGQSALVVKDALSEVGNPVVMIGGPGANNGAKPAGCEFIADAVVEKIAGVAGDFQITLNTPSGFQFVEAGAVVAATEPELVASLLPGSLGDSDKVAMLKDWAVMLAGDAPKEKVAVWMDYQEQEARSVCGEIVDALEKSVAKGDELYLLFQHMPVYGYEGQKRYDELRKNGVKMLRYVGEPTASLQGEKVVLEITDALMPERALSFEADRLVMPEKLRPAAGNQQLADVLLQPLDQEGFLQTGNLRHAPIGSTRRGVFYAGRAHGDFDASETAVEAKAIAAQIATLLAAETVMAPRELATVDVGLCASCLTCLRSCQHGAIKMAEGSSVEFIDGACWECGVCAAVCPRKAITRSSFSDTQLRATIKEAVAPIDGKKPVVAFLCRNSASQALDEAGARQIQMPDDVLWIEVPCAGHISETEVLHTLAAGARKVEVFGCQHDNCRSVIGSESADNRIFKVRNSLENLGMNKDAVCFHSIAANEADRLAHIIQESSEE